MGHEMAMRGAQPVLLCIATLVQTLSALKYPIAFYEKRMCLGNALRSDLEVDSCSPTSSPSVYAKTVATDKFDMSYVYKTYSSKTCAAGTEYGTGYTFQCGACTNPSDDAGSGPFDNAVYAITGYNTQAVLDKDIKSYYLNC